MITIDGAQMSGSGTIVRYAVALAALRGESIRVINARQRRRQPGLRPQHVTGVHACAQLCGATVKGWSRQSTFDFIPGSGLRGGSFDWHIGTSVWPPCWRPVCYRWRASPRPVRAESRVDCFRTSPRRRSHASSARPAGPLDGG